ncbi:hypothetical protein Landi51_01402 [Colletotrichum acutatum]
MLRSTTFIVNNLVPPLLPGSDLRINTCTLAGIHVGSPPWKTPRSQVLSHGWGVGTISASVYLDKGVTGFWTEKKVADLLPFRVAFWLKAFDYYNGLSAAHAVGRLAPLLLDAGVLIPALWALARESTGLM